jgi:hypothetical protein
VSLTNIASAKDAQQSFQPLLLAEITFHDGTILRLSTHPLNTAEGGYQYGGNDYLGRIISQDIGAVQGYDSTGIDLIPRVALTLADADKVLKIDYEDVYGFSGATLDLIFIFWDADTSTFSSDSIQRFRGICDAAQCDAETLTVSAANKLNLQRRSLPPVPLQRRCPWIFPTTVAARQAAADNADDISYECGYSPDATGSNARGNFQSGSTPFSSCGYTKSDCVARGMYETDSSSRKTGRFGGVQRDAFGNSSSREYTSGQVIQIQNNPSEASLGQPIPMVYGTAWVDAIVLPIFGDGNSTRFEAVVCLGEVENILHVVVNNETLQPATDITGGTNYRVENALFRYNIVNRGGRSGAPNEDVPWNGDDDPSGSRCTILCVVPRRVAEANSTPRVRVLVQGPKIRVYTDVSTYSQTYSENPVWIIMDLLTWLGISYAELELQTFIDAAAICSASISYTDQYGATSSHARYSCSLVLRQRRSAADVIRGVRQGCGAVLVPNSSTGKLQIFIEGTLASQQPSAVAGSNYNTAITSKSLSGSATNGYVAYDFTKFLGGRQTSFKVQTPPLSAAPNRVSFQFANSERDWTQDSISVMDTEAVTRAGQEVAEQIEADGINNLDQAKRIAARRLGRNLYGNARGDAGGTEIYTWTDSFRTVRCRVGQIVRASNAHYGISNILIRVTQMRPSTNFETVQITGHRHDDDWYIDTYGQAADPETALHPRDRLARAAYPWGPTAIAPASGDPMFAVSDQTFTLAEGHETAADGTIITKLYISGAWPVNLFSGTPPSVGRQGTTSSTGGAILGSGRTYWAAVVALDAFGAPSAPSTLCQIVVTNASTANTVTIPILGWPDSAAGYIAYLGSSPQLLTEHASASGSTPTSIIITSFQQRSKGMPDPEFDRMRVKVKRVAHSGVWGQPVDAVAAGTLEVTGAGWTVNQWAGYDVSFLGKVAGGDMAVLNYSVVSNTADVLTVTPDPDGDVAVGDAIIMRSKPTVGSDGGGNYLSDALWQNTLENSGGGLAVDEEVGRLLRIISGPGAGQTYRIISNTATKVYIEGDWLSTPTSASRYIIEEPDWQVIQTSDSLNNADLDAVLYLEVEVSNYRQRVVLVQPVALDGGMNESIDVYNPVREIYVFGAANPAAIANSGYYQVAGADSIAIDLANGLNQELTGDRASTDIEFPTVGGAAPVEGLRFSIKLLDTVDGAAWVWHADYIGAGGYPNSGVVGEYAVYRFVIRPDGKAELCETPLIGVTNV